MAEIRGSQQVEKEVDATRNDFAAPGAGGPEEEIEKTLRRDGYKAAKNLVRRFAKSKRPLSLGRILERAAEMNDDRFLCWLLKCKEIRRAGDRSPFDKAALGTAFVAACRAGQTKSAGLINKTESVERNYIDLALKRGAKDGLSSSVAWLLGAFAFGGEAISAAVAACCARGDVELAKRLFGSPSREKESPEGLLSEGQVAALSRGFATACGGGHQEAAKWLISVAPGVATKKSRGRALVAACIGNQPEIAQWLIRATSKTSASEDAISSCDLTRRDFDLGKILEHCCAEGHLETLAWLKSVFCLTARDFSYHHGSPLLSACYAGHLFVVRWLAESGLIPPGADLEEAIDMSGSHPDLESWLRRYSENQEIGEKRE